MSSHTLPLAAPNIEATHLFARQEALGNSQDEVTKANIIFFYEASEFYNRRFFTNNLPPYVLTFQTSGNTKGFFKKNAYSTELGPMHQIMLNPDLFDGNDVETLATFFHQLAHACAFNLLPPARKQSHKSTFHSAAWVRMMVESGFQITISDPQCMSGQLPTILTSQNFSNSHYCSGQNVSHTIVPSGRFEQLTQEFLGDNDLRRSRIRKSPEKTKLKKSRTEYYCEKCKAVVHGRKNLVLFCQHTINNEAVFEPMVRR